MLQATAGQEVYRLLPLYLIPFTTAFLLQLVFIKTVPIGKTTVLGNTAAGAGIFSFRVNFSLHEDVLEKYTAAMPLFSGKMLGLDSTVFVVLLVLLSGC